MNKLTKTVILGLSVLGAFALSAQAHPHSDADVTDHQAIIQAPVPIKIIHPGISPAQVGKVVNVRFDLDANGKTSNVESTDANPTDTLLTARVIRAMRSWEFEPARNASGEAIAVTVEMPIVVDRIGNS